MQALKLFWFIRDEMGHHNSYKLSNGQIQGIVAKVVKHYWTMASYETVEHCPALTQVKRILKTCLNIGAPGLRESLGTDRVRVNLGIASEDIGFLDDQLGPRLHNCYGLFFIT